VDDDLYHRAIVALARDARAEGRLVSPSATATVTNPLCGDRVTIDVALERGTIRELRHKVRGCVLCRAAAAVIGRAAPGAPALRARRVAEELEAMLERRAPAPHGGWEALGNFLPVAAHKSRHECVLLPFEALVEALDRAEGER
jgi:nitrogen fixation NifU-like protein